MAEITDQITITAVDKITANNTFCYPFNLSFSTGSKPDFAPRNLIGGIYNPLNVEMMQFSNAQYNSHDGKNLQLVPKKVI